MNEIRPEMFSKKNRLKVKKNKYIECNFKGYLQYNDIYVHPLKKYSIYIDKCSFFKIYDSYNNNILCELDGIFIPTSNRIYIRLFFVKGNYVLDSIELQRIDIIKINKYLFKLDNQIININDIFDKIFVINLKKDIENKNKCIRMFKNNGIYNYEFMEAIDGSRNIVQNKYNSVNTQIVNSNALGCLLSHIKILYLSKKRHYKKILIFEDDIIFHKNINKMFSFIYSKIPSDWQLLYLGTSQTLNTWYNIDLKDNYYNSYKCNGTFAYAINMSIYNELFKLLWSKKNNIDTLLHFIQDKYKCYTMIPNIVISDIRNSSIGKCRNIEYYSKLFGWKMENYKL